MKIYNYFSILISLIFTVMGILILSNTFSSSFFFRDNDTMRYAFGGLLVVYGLFRAYNSYAKLKRSNSDEEENRYRL